MTTFDINAGKRATSKLVLASNNAGKIREMEYFLTEFGWTLQSMADYRLESPEETGQSFEENAALKATFVWQQTGEWALADDSGLEVDCLGGAPGVATADFGGWERLLKVMETVPEGERGAQFVCVLALKNSSSAPLYFRGVCRGTIALQASGAAGFGYDPVFIPEGDKRTFAEMTKEEKQGMSHRGMALRELKSWLRLHQVRAN